MEADTTIDQITTKAALQPVSTDISKFIDIAARAQEELIKREQALQNRMQAIEQLISSEISQIQNTISTFQEILKSTNAKSWQEKTDSLYKEGKQQLLALQNFLNEMAKSTKDGSARVETMTTQVVKNISKSLQTLHTHDLEQLADDAKEKVKLVADSAVNNIQVVIQWFHWKNLALTIILAFIVTLFIGLYIDDEWPWEEHKAVVKERDAGHAVLQVWSELNYIDQQHIASDKG